MPSTNILNFHFLTSDLQAIATAMPPTDTNNPFTNVSGIPRSTSDNPYDAMLEACKNDPVSLYYIAIPLSI